MSLRAEGPAQAHSRDHGEGRYARRRQIGLIDELLNELELLNLAGESEVPDQLSRRTARLIMSADTPSMAMPPDRAVSIADWMAALFEVQDTLMIPRPGETGAGA
jgi:hypothetical protein